MNNSDPAGSAGADPFADRNNDGVPDRLQTVMANPSPRRSDGTGKSPLSPIIGCAWKGALVLVLALSGCPAYRYWYDRKGDADRIIDVVFADDVIVGVESIHHVTSTSRKGGFTQSSAYDTYRLSAIGVKDGELVAREVLGDHDERSDYIGPAGDGYWFYGVDPDVGLHAIDPRTLQPRHTREELIARNPSLASMIATPTAAAERHYCIDTASGRLYATTSDGHGYLIDPGTLAASQADGRPECPRRDPDALEMRVKLPDGPELRMDGDPRQEIMVRGDRDNVRLAAGLTFLNGRFICESERRTEELPLDVGMRGKVLVAHESRIGEGAAPIISLVAVEGTPRVEWSLELKEVAEDGHLGPMRVERAHRAGGSVIVVVGVRAYCIDPKSGAVRWTRHF